MSTNATIAALAAACALAAVGCEATITPARPTFAVEVGPAVAPVATVPADIWARPRVVYGGTYVYLVDGSWYQPTPGGWVVLRREPPELERARVRIFASPQRRPRTPAYGYPPIPAPREAPPLQAPTELGRERTPNP